MTLVTNGVPIEHSLAMSTDNLLPALSAIARAIDAGRPCPRKENLGVDGVDRQRPDGRHVPLRAEPLPLCSAIMADEQARIPAGKNRLRLCRMHGQRLDATIQRKRGAMAHP